MCPPVFAQGVGGCISQEVGVRDKLYGLDMFCGSGGATQGLLRAAEKRNLDVDLVAINHDKRAIQTHSFNHPQVRHFQEWVDNLSPAQVCPRGYLDVFLAGPECTNHAPAKGNKPLDAESRASASHITRFAQALNIRSLLIENIPNFENWGPLVYDKDGRGRPDPEREGEAYQAFLGMLRALGFTIESRRLNAKNYGDAQDRERLFIIGKRDGRIVWPEPTHGPGLKPYRTAREIIDWSIPGTSIFDRPEPLVEATLHRIEVGIERYGWGHPFLVVLRNHKDVMSLDEPLPTVTTSGNHFYLCEPFLIKYYGTNTVSSIDEPLPTVTTRDRFALITPGKTSRRYDINYRLFTYRELARAQGFPDTFQFAGTQTDAKRQIGNAWPNNLAEAVCSAVLAA